MPDEYKEEKGKRFQGVCKGIPQGLAIELTILGAKNITLGVRESSKGRKKDGEKLVFGSMGCSFP